MSSNFGSITKNLAATFYSLTREEFPTSYAKAPAPANYTPTSRHASPPSHPPTKPKPKPKPRPKPNQNPNPPTTCTSSRTTPSPSRAPSTTSRPRNYRRTYGRPNASEKDARAAAFGAVKRVLSPRDIVVLDGLNYIKGWRYQLYCEAKNSEHFQLCAAGGKEVEESGGKKAEGENDDDNDADDTERYKPASWENLVFRYEEPNPMARWDSPLFTLVWEDDEAQTKEVFDKIWDTIAGEGRKLVRPNQSTVQRDKDPGGDYLYILERETQASEGRRFWRGKRMRARWVRPCAKGFRRAFVALNRGGIGLEAVGTLAAERLRESFVGYLNDAFEKDF
ncbi:hypothetical protein CHGG_05610 [Chaetomium globosum CBS 148.51]|uniref:Uncharacterized protein n=1 Tax=Chaetomium globosum (strain ATCC 6205 / CBS 148.51 / DSM 1962 / NBRC 6347 / NRRL 1970) TaxID=306901 RepID=Q2H6V5_CHAGB|nr:uncharacterized protein CHGG_05610 [Chaetomium globosum CBS 148.51]EAQ88991.1 hypothetical protein CHGG_05610 [Chaetomium globosum CBS 148.51]